MSTKFTVTVELDDPFDVVPAADVTRAVETALGRPETGLLGMNARVAVSKVTTPTRPMTRSETWAWMVSEGVHPDTAEMKLAQVDRLGSYGTGVGRRWFRLAADSHGKITATEGTSDEV